MSDIPQSGQAAPEFTAKDQNENLISLKDFVSDWLVLYFYPKDNTPGCTTEAQDFSTYYKEFNELGAKIVGVSPDSEKSHCRFNKLHPQSLS